MQDFSASKNYDNSLFLSSFSTLKDPRRQSTGSFRHQLMNMIFRVISAVVSGADDWEHIETQIADSQNDQATEYRTPRK